MSDTENNTSRQIVPGFEDSLAELRDKITQAYVDHGLPIGLSSFVMAKLAVEFHIYVEGEAQFEPTDVDTYRGHLYTTLAAEFLHTDETGERGKFALPRRAAASKFFEGIPFEGGSS